LEHPAHQKYLLRFNHYNGIETEVMLNDEMRLRQARTIGATRVGCTLFDPYEDNLKNVQKQVKLYSFT